MLTAKDYINYYQLKPHPEGGYYKETYRAPGYISKEVLPTGFGGARNFSTAIYFLLLQNNFSAFHRIQSDECWHFYAGGRLNIFVIHTNGQLEIIHMGQNIIIGEKFQHVVPAGCCLLQNRQMALYTALQDARLHRVLILKISNWQMLHHLYNYIHNTAH